MALILTKLEGGCDGTGFKMFERLHTLTAVGYWWHRASISHSIWLYLCGRQERICEQYLIQIFWLADEEVHIGKNGIASYQ